MILYFINLCILCTFPMSTLQEAPTCTIRQNPGKDVQYVCCARTYLDNGTCKGEESANPTYKNNSFDPQKRRNFGKSSMNIPINEENDLDIFYWIPKLHHNPYLKKECPIGTTSKKGANNKSDCVICESDKYGLHCIKVCRCNASERCDYVHGCIIPITTEAGTTITNTITSKTTPSNYADEREWMMILSSSVVVLCLVIVMAIGLSKCCSRIKQNRAQTIKEMSKKDKDKLEERKTNVYGRYEKKSITTDDDEFEFDTDNDDEEEEYAMIRDSQVCTTNVNTDELDDNCIEYNQYNTCYNHLHLMGAQRSPSNQKETGKTNYSHAIYGNTFFSPNLTHIKDNTP